MSGCCGEGEIAIEDEGVAQGNANTLDVVGGGASIAVAAGVATLTVPAPPAVEIAIEDEGVAQGNASTLDVVGGGASIAVAAGVATLTVPTPSDLAEGPFGSGIDGDINFDGTNPVAFGAGVGAQSLVPAASVYTLTRDVFANNLTIATGIEVRTAGYAVFVKGALAINGTGILGERAGNGGNGAAGAAGAGGTAGAAVHVDANRRYQGGIAGGAGGAGDGGTGGGGTAGGGASPCALTATTGAVAAGANGGKYQGGGGGSNSNGGAGLGATVAANTYDINQSVSSHSLATAISGRPFGATATQWRNGSSGAGGRGAPGGAGGGGGGGGGACCAVGVFAKTITGTGTIRAIGGNGGNGNNAAGGGGGGSGGTIDICTQSALPLSVTVSAAGGGAGNAGGAAGTTAGGTGGAGEINYYKP